MRLLLPMLLRLAAVTVMWFAKSQLHRKKLTINMSQAVILDLLKVLVIGYNGPELPRVFILHLTM